MANRIVIPTRPLVLPKTGQTTSYDTGDDGDYEAGNPMTTRFQATADGTVLDHATGLEWIADPAADPGSPFDAGMTWADALSNCEGLTFAGHSDWRLPNVLELVSIANYAEAGPTIYTALFGYEDSTDKWWSSTTRSAGGTYAMYLAIYYSLTSTKLKTDATLFARPVRGGVL